MQQQAVLVVVQLVRAHRACDQPEGRATHRIGHFERINGNRRPLFLGHATRERSTDVGQVHRLRIDIQLQVVDNVTQHRARAQNLHFGRSRRVLLQHHRDFEIGNAARVLLLDLQQAIGLVDGYRRVRLVAAHQQSGQHDGEYQPAILDKDGNQVTQVNLVFFDVGRRLIHVYFFRCAGH